MKERPHASRIRVPVVIDARAFNACRRCRPLGHVRPRRSHTGLRAAWPRFAVVSTNAANELGGSPGAARPRPLDTWASAGAREGRPLESGPVGIGRIADATPQRHSGGASPEAQPGIQEQGEYPCSHVPGVLLDSRFRGNDVAEKPPGATQTVLRAPGARQGRPLDTWPTLARSGQSWPAARLLTGARPGGYHAWSLGKPGPGCSGHPVGGRS